MESITQVISFGFCNIALRQALLWFSFSNEKTVCHQYFSLSKWPPKWQRRVELRLESWNIFTYPPLPAFPLLQCPHKYLLPSPKAVQKSIHLSYCFAERDCWLSILHEIIPCPRQNSKTLREAMKDTELKRTWEWTLTPRKGYTQFMQGIVKPNNPMENPNCQTSPINSLFWAIQWNYYTGVIQKRRKKRDFAEKCKIRRSRPILWGALVGMCPLASSLTPTACLCREISYQTQP